MWNIIKPESLCNPAKTIFGCNIVTFQTTVDLIADSYNDDLNQDFVKKK